MLWGLCVLNPQRYRALDWASAAVITWGVYGFLILGEVGGADYVRERSSTYGLTMLLTSFVADGFTPIFQEKLFRTYMSKYNQLFYLNGGSAAISIAILML